MRAGSTPSQDIITMPINRFLVPGKNTLEAAVLSGDPTPKSAYFNASVRSYADDKLRLAEFDWKEAIAEPGAAGPAVSRVIPFDVEEAHPRPAWMDAKPESFPTHGSAELRAPIRELEAALAAGSSDGVFNALSFRAAEFYRMEKFPEAAPDAARALAAEHVKAPFDVRPARDEDLVFSPAAGGRAVRVDRRDGTPAIQAMSTTDSKTSYVLSPLMVRHDGRFRMFS